MNQSKSPKEIFSLWQKIKLLRNLDLDRLRAQSGRDGAKLVTERDWMIAALLQLASTPTMDPKPT